VKTENAGLSQADSLHRDDAAETRSADSPEAQIITLPSVTDLENSDPSILDRTELSAAFSSAGQAFQRQGWEEAASHYRRISRSCAGSLLALECDYMAIQADWQRRDPKCSSNVLKWLENAQSYRSKNPGKTLRKLDAWVNQSQRMLAQWDRSNQKCEQAEQRLRALLQLEDCHRDPILAWPEEVIQPSTLWLELGLMHARQQKKWSAAIPCLTQAIQLGGLSTENQCAAQSELANCHLANGDWNQAAENLRDLQHILESPEGEDLGDIANAWKIRLGLLQYRWKKAQGDLLVAAEALKPAVEIALASHPETVLLYELALALLEAKENATADTLLLEVVHRDPASHVAIEARIRLAKHQADSGNWKETCELLDEAIERGCPESMQGHAYLMRGRAKMAMQLPESARDDLVLALQFASPSGNVELETAIRFDLAEALSQLQQWNEVQPHWEFLTRRASAMSGQDGIAGVPPTGVLPTWIATVWLRQAEMLASRKGWGEAETIVYQIREQFPECNRMDEVDYLLARCLVSKAQFDDARSLLQRIASNPEGHSPELVARSWWMIGETHLMQRKYTDAIAAYEQVLGSGAQQYWISAAWMQMGQCYELLRDVSSARVVYQQIVDRDSEGVLTSQARDRLAALLELPPNARTSREGLGEKQR
jgi:tetratricopeptide (TPR) repeat protein